MKKINLLVISVMALFLLSGVTQAQVFMVVSGGENPVSTPYDDLETAVKQAEAGSTVYIPRGEHLIKGSPVIAEDTRATTLLIDKKLNLIGAGAGEGTMHNSVINGNVTVTADASGSVFEGVTFGLNYSYILRLDNVSNFLLKRCLLPGNIYLSGKGDGNIIRECQVNMLYGYNSLYGYQGFSTDVSIFTKILMQNCVVTSGIWYVREAIITNSVFTNYNPFTSIHYCTVSNNILTYNYVHSTSSGASANNTFTYNLLVGTFTPTAGNLTENNIESKSLFSIFGVASAPESVKYKLADDSPGIGAGNDGTDIGLYGSPAPAKEQRIPSTPSVTEFSVSGVSAADGKLPVKITVEAQE